VTHNPANHEPLKHDPTKKKDGELSMAAAAVGAFLHGRKRYAGRERLMAVDGTPLNASDLQKLVDHAHASKPEVAQKTAHGSINPIPFNDDVWMDTDATKVTRLVTEWKEVTDESGS
jgi:hypothetical protein